MHDPLAAQKWAQEKVVATFDFSDELATGETVTTVVARDIEVLRGTDASPSALLNGGAQSDVTGKLWLQGLQGGTRGNRYRILLTTNTTNASKVLARELILEVM